MLLPDWPLTSSLENCPWLRRWQPSGPVTLGGGGEGGGWAIKTVPGGGRFGTLGLGDVFP